MISVEDADEHMEEEEEEKEDDTQDLVAQGTCAFIDLPVYNRVLIS